MVRPCRCSSYISEHFDENFDSVKALIEIIFTPDIVPFLILSRVQELFLLDEDDEDEDDGSEQPTVKFYFGDIISYRNPKTNVYGMKVDC